MRISDWSSDVCSSDLKPWITPEGAHRRCPSSTWWPVTTTPRTIVGAEVIETIAGDVSHMPTVMSTWPLSPKSGHGLPVRESTAPSRAPRVPEMMRVAQGALAARGAELDTAGRSEEGRGGKGGGLTMKTE